MSGNIGLSASDYEAIISQGACDAGQARAILDFIEARGGGRVLVFGASTTGRAVRDVLGNTFAGFTDSARVDRADPGDGDCVLVAASPLHVEEIKKTLAASPLAGLPVFEMFSDGLDVRLVLETQPRSGTGYFLKNLRRSLGLGLASTFSLDGGIKSPDQALDHLPGPADGYVVKSHFTKPLHQPAYRFCPTLFIVGYFPDSYCKWARMNARPSDRDSYYLKADSPEWKRVRAYIPLHLKWLDHIRRMDFIRYEDLFRDFEGVLDVFERLLGQRPVFETPRMIGDRVYFTDDYSRLMDKTVFEEIMAAFAGQIDFYYPEKA